MNGYTKWLIGIFLTITLAFGGAMLRAGAVEYKVSDNKKVIEKQEDRLDQIEQDQATVTEHLVHIDGSLEEIKLLLKEHVKDTHD
jgi:hypothetical protein